MANSKQVHLIAQFLAIAMMMTQTLENNIIAADSNWLDVGKMTGTLLQNCWNWAARDHQQNIILQVQTCLKQKALVALSRMLQYDVIDIFDGVAFVRYTDGSANLSRQMDNNVQQDDLDLESQLIHKIADVFETHVLKIRLEKFVKLDFSINEARHRRRPNNNMMPFMVFGVVAMGMILIPMGFKFLAVLGGKALLLAKMALLLSSIQGLKKVATSNFNYGLYQSPPANPWHHDRHGHDDIPDEQLDLLHHGYVRS